MGTKLPFGVSEVVVISSNVTFKDHHNVNINEHLFIVMRKDITTDLIFGSYSFQPSCQHL